jgi:cytochrome c biogenesis protein CcmG, thiol:disulfide interchange protein DsbE
LRRALWLVPVVALFVVGGVGLFRVRPNAQLGQTAPTFELPKLRGDGHIALEDLRGKPLVVNFWASWCDPCKDEAPEFARTAERMRGKVRFLGVTMLDGRDEALSFVKRYGIGFESVRDTRGVIAKRFGVTGVPETAFIDARGRLVGTYIGAFTKGQLARAVRDLVDLEPGELLRIAGRGETRPVP